MVVHFQSFVNQKFHWRALKAQAQKKGAIIILLIFQFIPGHCLRTRQEQRRGFSIWHWRPHCFRTSFACLPSDQDKRLVVGLSAFKQRIKLYSEGPWRGMWWCCPHHVRDLNSSSGSALLTTEWVELRTYLAGGWAMPHNFSKSGDPLWLRLFGYITSTILLTGFKDI